MPSTGAPSNGKTNRALPQWAIDQLINGAPDFTRARKIWGLLMTIAMSAQARGWSRQQFINEVTKHDRRKNKIGQRLWTQHRLWEQIKAYSRDDVRAFKEIDRAWDQATANRLSEGFRTPEDLIADAIERAFGWDDRIQDGRDNLNATEILVMTFVATQICDRNMSKVTCPIRDVAAFTSVAPMTASRTLKRLVNKRFLQQFSKGNSAGAVRSRKAAIYGLGDPFTLTPGGNQ